MKHSSFLLPAALLAVACNPSTKKKDSPATAPVGSGKKFHVAVMDSGFDVTHPVFKDKIVAQYTHTCTSDSSTDDSMLTVEQLKARVIADAKNPKPSCTLTEGIALDKSPSFADIKMYRAPWNSYFQKQTTTISAFDEPTFNSIYEILMGESKYSYHGTATASLVAYNNTKADLVLIQTQLQGPGEEAEMGTECDKQANIDKIVTVLSDAEVIKAVVEGPVNPDETLIDELLTKHDIDFINKSFGIPSTAALEKMYEEAGCKLSLGKLIAAQSNIENQREDYLRANGTLKAKTLSIAAAGNDGVTIDSTEDQGDCDHPFTISVAATIESGSYATFSNRGKCIDVKAPGQDIIVAFPELFIGPNSGTSFSSPLFVRYLTQSGEPLDSYAALYKSLKDSNKDITQSGTPLELLVSNKKKISSFALQKQGPAPLPRKKFKIRFR